MKYILLNKPFEVLTQFTDENGRATLKDFVSVPDVYPVGRLDFDSEGLVLLTDDKQLQHRLSDPKFKVPKTYWAQVEGAPTDADLEPLQKGILLGDKKTLPAQAYVLEPQPELWERSKPIRFRQNIPTTWIALTITQGMNRQVRRMTAAVGFPTLRLVRVKIGPLQINNLQPGEWRELEQEEILQLRKFARSQPGSSNFRKN